MGPDATQIEIGSLFYRACDFSLDSGLSGFQTQFAGFTLPYLFMQYCFQFILQNACIDTVCVTLLNAKWSKNLLFS